MGKKNKNRQDNDDEGFKEGDFSTKFVSHKAAIAQEAAEADRAAKNNDSDDGAANKKQRKRKGGHKELDSEFVQPTKTKVVAGDSDVEIDLQKEIEENFEGVSKKNTRKKKNNNANIYGGQDQLAGAFDEEADEDEIHAKKGGKTQKGGKHQGKKNKNKQAKEESEPEEEEKKVEEPEKPETESEEEEKEFPINMIYCGCKYYGFISYF